MKSLSKLRVALVAGLFLAGAGLVSAYAGMWAGLPAATSSPSALNATTLPITGNETAAFDTNLSGGRNPQTETISTSQLRTYIFGNGGSSTGQITTATAASGAATCNAALCLVNSEALTTALSGQYTLLLSNSTILSTSIVLASVGNVSNTSTGATIRTITNDTVNQGAVTINVLNSNGITFNGTIRFKVTVIN